MQANTIQVPRPRMTRPVVAALAVLASCAAWAEDPNPYYIGISERLTHDTNIYRTPNPITDDYSTASLVGGFDQAIGRQRIYAAGTIGYNRYRDQTTLNHTSYGVNAGWDWASIEKFSGNVYVNANQGLATVNGNSIVPTSTANILNTEQLGASLQWGDARLSAVGTYGHSRVNYSAPEYVTSNATGNSASAGLYYSTNPDLKVGVALRFTRTETPSYSPHFPTPVPVPPVPDYYLPNTDDGRNLDFTANWQATAQTGINARLSWTKTTNSNPAAQDFSGPTGAIYANYAPTAKLAFNAGVSRSAGTYGSYFNNPNAPIGAPVTGLNPYSQTTDAYSLGAAYAATPKISVNATVAHNYSKYAYPAAPTVDYDDNLRTASLGVTYVGAKHWSLGCNTAYESRNVSGPGRYWYTGSTFSCFGQFTLR